MLCGLMSTLGIIASRLGIHPAPIPLGCMVATVTRNSINAPMHPKSQLGIFIPLRRLIVFQRFPSRFIFFSRCQSSSMSTAITRALRAAAPAMVPKPIAPHPNTNTVSSGKTSPRATAWKPTVRGSTRVISLREFVGSEEFLVGNKEVFGQCPVALHT